MILYCKESLGCIDNNNTELINNDESLPDSYICRNVTMPEV